MCHDCSYVFGIKPFAFCIFVSLMTSKQLREIFVFNRNNLIIKLLGSSKGTKMDRMERILEGVCTECLRGFRLQCL